MQITLHKKVDSGYYYIISLYGITQDPETKNYIIVLFYASNGSLRNYLNINTLSWYDKINNLQNIAYGLYIIHLNELTHRDLHIGNILQSDITLITDMGLCKPADYNALENSKKIYGVLPTLCCSRNFKRTKLYQSC